jgi:hypothetical protein
MCPCDGKYDNRLVPVHMTVAGQVVMLPDVPQGLCSRCGSRVYKADILERIELLMRAAPVDIILNRPAV